jgi:hypothetical protein
MTFELCLLSIIFADDESIGHYVDIIKARPTAGRAVGLGLRVVGLEWRISGSLLQTATY